MERDSFVFKKYYFEAAKQLNDADFKEIMTALMDYAFDDIYPQNLSACAKALFTLTKNDIDLEKKRYDKAQGRKTKDYLDWRMRVFKRDDFTCQLCHKKGGKLNAHHIKPYAGNPSLRLDLDNGITLCEQCHRRVHREK